MDILQLALTQGIVPAIVVIIYLVTVKIIDSRKEKNQSKLTAELSKSILTISEYIVDINKNIIDKDKEKCKNMIEATFKASALNLVQFLQRTILQNHLDTNRNNILANIHSIVNSEYYSIYSNLNLYQINGTTVSDYLDKNWIRDVEKDMIDCLYGDIFIEEQKVTDFTNKVQLKFDNYITYITNKITR